MAPVLTSNYDYDYDTLQPYFLPEEEDFYPTDGRHLVPGPGPGEDMWKKFELLPTPPHSPRHTPSLQTMCDVLDHDCTPSSAFTSYIIQDCMWSSSFAAAAKLDQVVSERLASLRARRESSASTDRHQDSSSSHDREERDVPAACTDPCEVLPGNTLRHKPSSCETNTEELVCLDSSALSSSDSETDEDEEDLDVDVVSIDRRKSPQPPDSQIKSFSPTPLVLKRSHIDIHLHNYAAATPHPSRHTHSPRKQTKTEGILSSSSSAVSSKAHGNDSDTDKRKIHNVLERQRRSELKMSFVELRDQIPDVKNNGKVAKVVILKKATEFIKQMKEEERDLIEMKERMKRKRRKLGHRLKQLRTPL